MVGDIFLVLVIFSFFACGLVVFMTATRLVWAMSRDRRFPGYQFTRSVDKRQKGSYSMVPNTLTNFFIASVGAGAALLGLLFVSISISPEEKITANASVEKRVSAYSALISLTNAFFISLVALIPSTFGIFVLISSVVTFAITLQNGIELLRPHEGHSNLVRRLILTLLNLFAYIAEGYYALRLIRNPRDSSPVYALTTLLLIVYILSIVRAWELLGGARRTPTHLLTAHPKQNTLPAGTERTPHLPPNRK